MAACLTAKGMRIDFEVETFLVQPVAHTLRGAGFDGSEDGTGRGTPLLPVPFDTTQITSAANGSTPMPGDPCHPLCAGAHAPAIAFDCKAGGDTGLSRRAGNSARGPWRRARGSSLPVVAVWRPN